MKRKKTFSIISVLLCVIFFALCLSGCGQREKTTEIRIASLKGPTTIGLAKLYSDSDNNHTELKYNYSICGTADEISTGLIKGEFDMAAVPANLAAILNKKTSGEIKIAAINTLGVLYLLEKNTGISSIADLKGHTIITTGQGTTPEYTIRHILKANGLDPDKDVTLDFLSEASEVAAKASILQQAVLMLPEPYVEIAKSKDNTLKVFADLTEEWEKTDSESTVITGVLVVNSTFAANNPNALSAMLSEYEASAKFANSNISECAEILEKLDVFSASVAKNAIDKCHVVFENGSTMITKLTGYFTALYNENPVSVGGEIPNEEAYIN